MIIPALARFCLAPSKNKLYFFPLPPTIFMFCPAAACTIPQMEIYKDFSVQFQYDFFFLTPLFSYSLTQMTLLTSPSFSSHFPRTHQYLPCRHTQQFKTCPMPYSAAFSPVNALQTIFPVKNLPQCESERGGSNCAFVTSELLYFHVISD